MKNAEIREKINQQIITALEKGTPPWIRPWRMIAEEGGGWHHNFISKRAYRGVNPLILEMAVLTNDWTSTAWGTFNQWKRFDCHVRKGEHATMVVLWKPIFSDETDDNGRQKIKTWLLRYYYVFNACQIDANNDTAEAILRRWRIPAGKEEVAPIVVTPDYARAAQIVKAAEEHGLVIKHGGNKACWKNGTDIIKMPKPDQFPTLSHYYETAFHEMGHWTELERLCNWSRKTHGYAMGELRAELCCCYLRQHADIPPGESLENHTAYIKSWLEQMRKDDQWIFKACRFADAAADCLLKMAGIEVDAEEEDALKAA